MIYTVFFRNNATKKMWSGAMENLSVSPRFYRFAIDASAILAAIGTGEGEYFVCPEGTGTLDGAEILDRGVLQAGKSSRQADTYDTERTYEQYGG